MASLFESTPTPEHHGRESVVWGFTSFNIKGRGIGEKINCPTINLAIPEKFNALQGVYSCAITIDKKRYQGVLYFGHRLILEDSSLHDRKNGDNQWITLEVHILNASKPELKKISLFLKKKRRITVQLGRFIRKPRRFKTYKDLQKQIQKDINKVLGEKV